MGGFWFGGVVTVVGQHKISHDVVAVIINQHKRAAADYPGKVFQTRILREKIGEQKFVILLVLFLLDQVIKPVQPLVMGVADYGIEWGL